jgi:hypothetical protein
MPVETRSQARARRLREQAFERAYMERLRHERALARRRDNARRRAYEASLAAAEAARQAQMRQQLQLQAEQGSDYAPSPTASIATTIPSYGMSQYTERIQRIPGYQPPIPEYIE